MTAQHLDTALSAVASIVASVSGVNSSPSFALFNINERIFALNYVMVSVAEIGALGTKEHHATIASDIITPLIGMTNEIDAILGIVDDVSTALISEMSSAGTGNGFSGALTTFVNLRVEFLPGYLYNNIPHIGYRVMLEDTTLKLDL